ncbi:MAG: hypothetical protein Q8Q38_00760 [bacterium]|nr:hypothetical protein [bacterium]MDZ4231930.1 hypothetical protein [Candidatus Pacearchaeota archaeon]
MNKKLDALAVAYASAILGAALMLLLGIAGNLGVYTGAVGQMKQWHMFFSLSAGGIISGMVEAAVISFAVGYAFAWVYNKLSK